MIKKALLGIAAVLFLVSAVSSSPPGRFGAGLMFFDPSGLSAKAWMSGSRAVAGGLGWSAEKNHYLHLHADFIFTTVRLASDRNLNLDFYLGVGGKIIFRDTDNAWFRIPLGIDFLLNRSPLNIFFEVVPSFNFSRLKLLGAVGFRYVFSD
ncbi:MAG: hypothetical protein JXE07_07145 [Candidatus Aminicenantes bacterium]|nr:hypothetical protein [Candidatus Aminicenantes bacterium]